MKATPISLTTFDDRLMDGLVFCRKVYRLFDAVSASPGGISRLRRRSDVTAKKLQEELFPIALYVRHRYDAGLRLRVRWLSGNQQYDAKVLCNGGYVREGVVPARLFLEVTNVMHAKDYLRRELLDTDGFTFGVGNISRDRKTRKITSRPHVYRGQEANDNMVAGILQVIDRKNLIPYPKETVLVVQCHAERLALLSDWEYVVAQVRAADPVLRFREVFLFEAVHSYAASLYAPRED